MTDRRRRPDDGPAGAGAENGDPVTGPSDPDGDAPSPATPWSDDDEAAAAAEWPPGYGPAAWQPGYGPAQAPRTNRLAVRSLVFSIVGLVTCLLPVGIGGAVLGYRARREIRRTGEGGAGLALAGILVGWVSIVLVLMFLVVLVSVPFLD